MMDMGGGSRERTAWVVGGIVVLMYLPIFQLASSLQ